MISPSISSSLNSLSGRRMNSSTVTLCGFLTTIHLPYLAPRSSSSRNPEILPDAHLPDVLLGHARALLQRHPGRRVGDGEGDLVEPGARDDLRAVKAAAVGLVALVDLVHPLRL